MLLPILGFVGIAFEIWIVAWGALAILILALLAAAANHFFSNVHRFDDDLREATMDLDPRTRRRFFELYESRHPKSAAVAWFLAIAVGPVGVNLYRGNWQAFFAAVISLNGLGAWWLESWFATPQLVLMKNKEYIAWTLFVIAGETAAPAPDKAPAPPLAASLPRAAFVAP